MSKQDIFAWAMALTGAGLVAFCVWAMLNYDENR